MEKDTFSMCPEFMSFCGALKCKKIPVEKFTLISSLFLYSIVMVSVVGMVIFLPLMEQ